MLLARNGYRVLLVDRSTFPSDTISTHLIHPPGVALLKKWGLLDRVAATGCPPIHTYAFDMGPFVVSGSPAIPAAPAAYSPRRTVLDKLLIDAAAEAGVEVREGFTVEEIVSENGRVCGIRGHSKDGDQVVERCRIVIGADGLRSFVARAVACEEYNARPPLSVGYYTYWSNLPMHGRFEAFDRGDRGWAAWPTNDGLTLVVVGWPFAEFEQNKSDIERHYLDVFERAPSFRDRIRAAKREERFVGTWVPNFFRKPFGPGWALVGDAGYTRDFMTAQGINDAFRDVDLCASALDRVFSGTASFEDALGDYQSARDTHAMPMYDFTCQFASFQPPTQEMQQLFGAIHGSQTAMDGFARMFGHGTSPAEFFSEENIGRIFAARTAAS
jgi:2-polyprenyl-6-methoxyphenol hydroxylase-like FAD-dependent oxidoreductase